jgi:uncharacterized lipoprotein YddW (UPF0748 family)
MLGAPVRCVVATLVMALGAFASPPAVSSADAPLPVAAADSHAEVRALWVVRTTLTSPAAVATMVASAKASGFNTLLVQVRGRGDAYFLRGVEPRPSALAAQPTFDPLAETIARARDAGLKVHAWINVNLVAGLDLPAARDHVIYRHPEWLMVPRAIATDLATVDPHSPEYLGRLSRYARSRSSEVEGLYLSPVSAAAADYTTAIVRDIAARYALDGVHLDYIRYPDDDFDYGRVTVAEFNRNVSEKLRTAERWRTFRADRLTALVVRLREAVKAVRPSALLSAAVAPDPVEAYTRRLQNWREWLSLDLLDVVCPMVYTTDAGVFAAQVTAARQTAGSHPLWAGIGAYRLSSAQVVDNVQTARRLGAGGVILFSYESLTDPSRGPDYLTRLGRAAFTQ